MRSIVWLIVLIMLLGWGFGFFVWAAPSIIHSLLVIALILVVYNLVSGNRARV
jgi:hypothetical protein